MDYDEIIPPSDSEEEEEWRASEAGYWEDASREISANRARFHDSITRVLPGIQPPQQKPSFRATQSYHGDASSPPRKRMRLYRSAENTPIRRNSSESVRDIQLSPAQLPSPMSLSPPSKTSPDELRLAQRVSLSDISNNTKDPRIQSLLTPSPALSSSEPDAIILPSEILEPEHIVRSQEMYSAPLLFTPPKSQEKVHNKMATPSPQAASEDQASSHLMMSPLTPLNSPQHSYPSPSHESPPHLARISRTPSPARARLNLSPEAQQDSPNEPEHEGRHYSLRPRRIAQIRPFSAELRTYKHAMRAIPDAIVEFKIPRRREHRARSREHGDSSDAEVDPAQFDSDASDGERPRRRRAASVGSEDEHRPIQKTPLRARSELHESSAGPRNTDKWQPAAFNDEFSGDEDDPLPHLAGSTSREGPGVHETEKKRRLKRFPMSKRSMQPQSSPRSSPERPSTVRQLSRVHSQRRVDSDDDVEMKRESARSPSWADIQPRDDEVTDGVLSVNESPPTSPRPSSSVGPTSSIGDLDLDHLPDPEYAGDDDDQGSDVNLSPRIRRNLRESARHWPHGEPVEAEGTSRSNPIPISDDESHFRVDDDDDEQAGTESDDEPDPLAIAQSKIIGAMYPAVYINKKFMEEERARKRARRHRPRPHDSDSNNGPVQPGHVRVRRRATPFDRPVIGDAESSGASSGEENGDASSMGVSEPPRSPTLTANNPVRKAYIDLVDISSDDESRNEDEDEDEDDVCDAVDDEARARWNEEGVSTKREESLINYMLNRTGVKKRSKKPYRRPKRPQSSRLPRTSSSGARIVTHGVRPHGLYRQTRLPFTRKDNSPTVTSPQRPAHAHSRAGSANEPEGLELSGPHRRSTERDEGFLYDVVVSASSKAKDRTRNEKHAGLYTFHDKGRRITTGRAHLQATVQEEEEWATSEVARNTSDSFARSMAPPRAKVSSKQRVITSVNPRSEDIDAFVQTTLHPHVTEGVSGARHGIDDVDQLVWPCGEEELDCGIPRLQSGLAFAAKTDLVEGRLQEVISSSAIILNGMPPPSTYFGQASISPMPIASFIDIVETGLSTLFASLSRDNAEIDDNEYEVWCQSLKNIGPWVTWFRRQASLDGLMALGTLLNNVLTGTHKVVEEYYASRTDSSYANRLVLEIQWHVIAMAYRIRPDDPFDLASRSPTNIATHFKLLISHLWSFGLEKPVLALYSPADSSKLYQRLAELWVCLIHISQSWGQLLRVGSVWELLQRAAVESSANQPRSYWYMASERMWGAIFSLCTLSQVTVYGVTTSRPRMPPSWTIVDYALSLVDLTLTKQDGMSRRRRKDLDDYIRLLIGRCLFLHHTWEWSMQDAFIVFKRLLTVFTSRHFSNLIGEKADYPRFLRESNLELLDEQKGNAYTLFLKLLVAAADDNQGGSQVKKLLSITGPVGAVSFKQASSHREFSALCNRLTFIAVAIYLDPNDAKNLVARARRYVDIKEMDHMTCRGYIRGAMYTGILMRKKGIPLQDVVDWLTEVADELTGQFIRQGLPAKLAVGERLGTRGNEIMVSIQMVLASISRIIAAEPVDHTSYPEPALLANRCIERICTPEAKLTVSKTMTVELQKLVLSYLDVRAKPLPSRFTAKQDGPESQEEYWPSAADFDDLEVMAAFSDDAESRERREREQDIVNRISDHIIPVLYRLICQGVQEADSEAPQKSVPLYGWIECWTACVSVVVRNGTKSWPFYVPMAEFAWKGLYPRLQRKLRLRFRHTTLLYDPCSYEKDKLEFLRIMLQCLVVPSMARAHDYVALVLWIDGLQHPLLRGLPVDLPVDRAPLVLSEEAFKTKRASFVEGIIANVTTTLQGAEAGDQALVANAPLYIDLVHTMLTTLKDVFPRPSTSGQPEYLDFCRSISRALWQSTQLKQHPTLRNLINWLHTELPPTDS